MEVEKSDSMKNSFKILLIATLLFFSACSNKEAKEPKEALLWIPGWQATSALNEGRAGAAYLEANGYIYIIGGLDGKKFMNTTEYAKIQPDGSLGPWKYGPPLNTDRAWMEGVAHNGYIYVVGGANATDLGATYAAGLLASVERARILPDGSLSPWVTEKNSMRMPRRCNKVAIWNNYLYAFGGYAAVMLDSVERTKIQEDGSLGEWIMEPEKLQVARYVNGVKAKKGALYIFAGHAQMNGVGLTSVEWAKVGEAGELDPWKYTSPLQTGRHGLAVASHGKDFYALGGYTGTELISSVEKTSLKENGELTPWKFTTDLATERINYSAIVYKDWIYVISGTNGTGYLTSVEYATFNDEGDIGFMGTKAEKDAYEKKISDEATARALAKKEMKFGGLVTDVLRTEGYTYIQVLFMNEKVWLAISDSKIKVSANDTIHFGQGLYMPNFYSKQLSRKFKELFFLTSVEVVEK